MIAIRLMGGLGNQMHQFAYGTYLSEVLNRDVVYDDTSFASDSLRDYALAGWQVEPRLASLAQRQLFPRRYGGRGWRGLLAQGRPCRTIKQTPFIYRPAYHKLPPRAYCFGYWQGEKFYPGMHDRLVKLFQPSRSLHPSTRELAQQIDQCRSISLHVRRTDYLKYPEYRVCNADYYRRAVNAVLASNSGARLFIFSDDPAWCRQNLAQMCPTTFVERSTQVPPHEDIWLMNRCEHHVVSNSSFSWWGAWLSQRGGQVHAPTPWLNSRDWIDRDIVPDRWHRLPGEVVPHARAA